MEKELLSKVGSYQFEAEPFHCDFTHRLFMGHLGNHMLNAADYHSHDRGYGMSYLNTVNKTWVLSRLAIEMDEMPEQYSKFDVETWVESAMKFFTLRNFAVKGKNADGEEKIYGYGRSVWAMIDTETRQPTDILKIHDGLINEYVETEKPCPIAKPSRVTMTDKATLEREIVARYNDIDVNGHVNSVKYIEHVLDLWPLDWYKSHRLKRFEIAYVAESHEGDTLRFYMEQTADYEWSVRIVKVENLSECANSDNKNSVESAKEVEVCRSKAKFVKD